jgi:hypothetical protein
VGTAKFENFNVMAMMLLHRTGCKESRAGKRSWLLKKLDSFKPLQKCSTKLADVTAETG